MDTKDIYIIRHGETEFNKRGMVQGSGIDSNLNEMGKTQASAFFDFYSQIPFDKVYTSQLVRTHQSVQQFIEDLALPWQQLYGLNEISWGYKEGKVLTDADDRSYFDMVDSWKRGQTDQKSEGGESPEEVQFRQAVAWKYLMSNLHEKKVLVCMHGRAMRILLCLLMQTKLKEMDNFKHQNLCLYHLRFENREYSIIERNSVEHLKNVQEPILSL